MTDLVRNCISCLYSREAELIGPDQKIVIGQKIHTCQYNPPSPVLLPNPQGGATLTPVFPIVNASISCAQHRFEDGSDDVPPPVKPN